MLIVCRLEHVTPCVGMVSTETTPTLPDGAKPVCVFVTGSAGSVIGSDCGKPERVVLPCASTNQARQVAVEKMFPDRLIPRAMGYEKLRGQGGLTEELALLWVRRCERFLAEALREANRKGKTLVLDGISFVDYEDGQPKINWKKLIFLYEAEKLVPLLIKLDDSFDDPTVPRISTIHHAVVVAIQTVVARTHEGRTEITIFVPLSGTIEIIARSIKRILSGVVLEVCETFVNRPSHGSFSKQSGRFMLRR